jgi:hypothetical protein
VRGKKSSRRRGLLELSFLTLPGPYLPASWGGVSEAEHRGWAANVLRMGGVMCCGSCVVTSMVVYVCVCRLADVSANRHTQTHRLLALQASRVWHVSLSFSTVHGGKGGGGGEGGEDGEGGEGVAKAAEATMLCVGAVCRRRQSGRGSQISISPCATTCRGVLGHRQGRIR